MQKLFEKSVKHHQRAICLQEVGCVGTIIPYPRLDISYLMRILKSSIIPAPFMNMSLLALITPGNQGPLQGHGPLSEGLNGWMEGLKRGMA